MQLLTDTDKQKIQYTQCKNGEKEKEKGSSGDLLMLSHKETVPISLSPLDERHARSVVVEDAQQDRDMPNLVTVEGEVEFPRQPSFRNTHRVEHDATEVGRSHHEHLRGRLHRERRLIMEIERVEPRHDAGEAHASEEPHAKHPPALVMELMMEHHRDDGHSDTDDRGQVPDPPDWMAQEAIVYGREEGACDERDDADVVEAPERIIRSRGHAVEGVCERAATEADHGTTEERIDWPSIDGLEQVPQRLAAFSHEFDELRITHLIREHDGRHGADDEAEKVRPDIHCFIMKRVQNGAEVVTHAPSAAIPCMDPFVFLLEVRELVVAAQARPARIPQPFHEGRRRATLAISSILLFLLLLFLLLLSLQLQQLSPFLPRLTRFLSQ